MNASTNRWNTNKTATFCTTVIASLVFTSAGLAQGGTTTDGPDTPPGVIGDRFTPTAGPGATNDNFRPAGTDKAGATRQGFTYDQIITSDRGEQFPETETGAPGPDTNPAGDKPLPPDHRVDVNGDKFVTVEDLLAFVSDYFSGKPTADVNGDGQIGTRDLMGFLDTFFEISDLGG